MDGDRERWNAKWRERAGDLEPPDPFVEEMLRYVPTSGRALDIAGGAGRHAVLLARHGLNVTLVDASDVALDQAERRAERMGLSAKLRYLRHDLDDPLPLAPYFDVVLIVDYLDRARRDDFVALVADHGFVLAVQPTTHNLERHPHPSARFLVEPAELPAWLAGLGFQLIDAREGWTPGGRHASEVLARRHFMSPPPPPAGPSDPRGPYR